MSKYVEIERTRVRDVKIRGKFFIKKTLFSRDFKSFVKSRKIFEIREVEIGGACEKRLGGNPYNEFHWSE